MGWGSILAIIAAAFGGVGVLWWWFPRTTEAVAEIGVDVASAVIDSVSDD